MKILIDMNLSPEWVRVFKQVGWESMHWTEFNDPKAPDKVLMEWAKSAGFLVFTHDLDFGALLSATQATGPSVIQLRCEDTQPCTMGPTVVTAIQANSEELKKGALMTIDVRRMRIVLLPLMNR